jgi:protein SCO1/2
MGTLPDFHLINQSGEKVGLSDFHGHVWVADFIFSRCPSICPVLTEKMGQLQHRARNLGNEFDLVSISVDPTFDTPEVLAAYAKEHHANPRRWEFLTGPTEEVQDTVVKGFKIAMGREPGSKPDDFLSIVHGSHFVLVDAVGRIRGYYDSNQPEELDRVMHDASLLINRGG